MNDKNENHFGFPTFTVAAFAILVLIRLALSSRLPVYILAGMPHDDAWVVNGALHILQGQWLGPYDQFTLIKGPFSPLLLAFSAWAGVTFTGLNTAIYCFASVLFVVALRPIVKNNIVQLVCLAILLFNPISFALDTGQRIYRNGIGQWQVLIIIGCLIALYLRRRQNWRVLFGWALLCGFVLGSYVLTREDATWLYPLVFVSLLSAIISNGYDREARSKALIFILPVFVAVSMSSALAYINYNAYGAPIINDRAGGYFAKVAGDLYAIAPDEEDARLYESAQYKEMYFGIYTSTMERALAVSPTLASAASSIRVAIRQWASWDDKLNTGQLSTDKMLFALRDGVRIAGQYQSLPETEAFYRKVHEELSAAFSDGRLVRRGISISPLIEPLQSGDIQKAILLVPNAISEIASFTGVTSAAVAAQGSEEGISTFHRLGGGEYYDSQGRLMANGWAFAKRDAERLTAALYDASGNEIVSVPLTAGDDVYDYMRSKGLAYTNAKKSRFSFDLNGYNLKSGVKLRLADAEGRTFREIPLNGLIRSGEDGEFQFYIDSIRTTSPADVFEPFVERANKVTHLYQYMVPPLSILVCVIYLFVTYLLARQYLRSEPLKALPVWLVLTGLISTLLFFVFIMCLITATAFQALFYLYTAPAYVVLLALCAISLGWILELALEQKKRAAND